MAYKFQLGSYLAQGSLTMTDGDLEAVDPGDIECQNASVSTSIIATDGANSELQVKADGGITITDANGKSFSVKGNSSSQANNRVQLNDVGGNDGQIKVVNAANELAAFGGSATANNHFGSSPNLATTANTGFFGLSADGTTFPIQMEGNNGEVRVTSAAITPANASSTLTVAGNLTVTGDLTAGEIVYFDTTNLKVESNTAQLNDDRTGALSSDGDIGGGFSIRSKARVVHIRDDARDGATLTAIGLQSEDGSSLKPIKAAKFRGDGSALHATVSNYGNTVDINSDQSESDMRGNIGKLLVIDASSSNVTLTLPATSHADVVSGIYWRIKLIGVSNSTHASIRTASATDTIDGADHSSGTFDDQFQIADNFSAFDLMSDGTNWFVV